MEIHHKHLNKEEKFWIDRMKLQAFTSVNYLSL